MTIYTKEEKLEIKKTMTVISNELRGILEKKGISEFKIRCPILYGLGYRLYCDDWYLYISSKKIVLFNDYNGHNSAGVGPFKLDKFSESSSLTPQYYNAAKVIISNFSRIKNEINEELRNRDDFLGEMQKIQEDHSSDVEIDFPESQNRQEIEIKHEDGKTIGTLYFGNQTVRIITRGEVVIIDGDKRDSFQKKIGRNY